MPRMEEQRRGRIEIPPTKGSKDASAQAFINSQIMAEFLDIDKHVAWHSSRVLDQVILKVTDEGWLIILKASRNGTRWVSFVGGTTLVEAIETCGEFANRGILTWQIPKKPPWEK